MDTFTEQIVKQRLDGKRMAIISLIIVGVLALNVLALLFLPYIFIFTLCGGGYGIWWVASSQSWEVEYCVTNGDIDIDRIIARRKRERIVQVHGDKLESLLPCTPERLNKHYDRVVMAASSSAAATWCFTYHSKKNGSTIVLFEPNDEVLDALRHGLSRLVQIETDRALREQ